MSKNDLRSIVRNELNKNRSSQGYSPVLIAQQIAEQNNILGMPTLVRLVLEERKLDG
jgi:hypothetical protein